MSNMTNTVAQVGVRVDPPGGGQVDDSFTYAWKNVAPGDYAVHAVLGDLFTIYGQRLPGAVSPPVSFVVLDRRTAADADGDGMPDRWESRYGLDPLRPGDATEDTDGITLIFTTAGHDLPSSSQNANLFSVDGEPCQCHNERHEWLDSAAIFSRGICHPVC